MNSTSIDPAIVTPVKGPGFFGGLLWSQGLQFAGARILAALGRRRAQPVRLFGRTLAVRHAQVRELLSRDLDFGIAEVNAVKIDEVNGGPFILGMDRSAALERERRALYRALSAVDLGAIEEEARRDSETLLKAVPAGGSIDIVGGYARPVATRTAMRLFGLGAVPEDTVMEVARSIFAHTFLNLSDDETVRERAIRAGGYMQSWFADEIRRRREAAEFGTDLMGRLMEQGVLDEDGVRRTLGGMFVGSIDTTATVVAKVVKVASRDSDLLRRMRADAGDLRALHGWCNEALRRWTHNPVLFRIARCDTSLSGLPIKAGETVTAATQAAMLDASVFEEPLELRPDRDPAAYLHLGAGVHPCAGRAVNRFQIPLLVAGLLRRGLGRVGKVAWAGPFPHQMNARLTEGPR
jgi:cytochrome P450